MGTVNGKEREKRIFTEEGCYIIAMLANTPAAAQFRRALAQILKEFRLGQITHAYHKGADDVITGVDILVRHGLSMEKLRAMTVCRGHVSQAATAKAFNIGAKTLRKLEKTACWQIATEI